jgi:superfamily II DNA helicase RecQ
MPQHVVVVGVTATLKVGAAEERVIRALGIHNEAYCILRRSNTRTNVNWDVRQLSVGTGGESFPDLRWVCDASGRTIIYCSTIALSLRVFRYLWREDSHDPHKKWDELRIYTACNSDAYNARTRDLMNETDTSKPHCRVIIATDTLAVGIDFPAIRFVIIITDDVTEPAVDAIVQKAGRVARNIRLVKHGTVLLLHSKSALKKAHEAVRDSDAGNAKLEQVKGKKMEVAFARLLLAPCKRAAQNDIYGNPPLDTPCGCRSCVFLPVGSSERLLLGASIVMLLL